VEGKDNNFMKMNEAKFFRIGEEESRDERIPKDLQELNRQVSYSPNAEAFRVTGLSSKLKQEWRMV